MQKEQALNHILEEDSNLSPPVSLSDGQNKYDLFDRTDSSTNI